MGSLFGGGGGGSAPPPVVLPPPPEVPTPDNKGEELRKARLAATKFRGRQKTILTTGQGDTSPTPGKSKTLLAKR